MVGCNPPNHLRYFKKGLRFKYFHGVNVGFGWLCGKEGFKEDLKQILGAIWGVVV